MSDAFFEKLFGDSEPTHLGSGWVSGVSSVFLGVLGLGGALCLHFPALLTLPDARAHYPMTIIRLLIQGTIVSALLLGAISAAAEGLSSASGRTFLKLMREFVGALAHVSDFPAAEFTTLEIEQLSATADRVIEAIERRLESSKDRGATQQELAESVYEIRREMEEITRWRRHYLH